MSRANTADSMLPGFELTVLNGLLNGADLLVTAEDFTPHNDIIFNHIMRLPARHSKASTALILALKFNHQFEKVGGYGRIAEMTGMPLDEPNLQFALEQVLEASGERSMAKIAKQMLDRDISPVEAEKKLAALNRRTTTVEPIIREREDQTPEPGAFPLDALNTTIREIAEETAETYQIDPALPAMTGVSTVNGAVGKRVIVTGATSGRSTHLNLFITPAAPKSYGKNAATIMVRPLQNASSEIANKFKVIEKPQLLAERKIKELREKMLAKRCAENEANEEEQAELVEIQARLPEILSLCAFPPSYTISNSTTAGLIEMLKRNGQTIFSFSPEAGELIRIALGKFNKDQAADFDLFLSGYTVEAMRETRIGRGDTGEFVPCISVLWFCQPFLLRELFTNEEALERGLTARVLPFVVEHGEMIPEDDGVLRNVSAAREHAWDVLVRRALALRDSSREIQCSNEAREIFREFHNEAVHLRNEQFRLIEGELGRWRENAIRVAGGQCIADALDKDQDLDGLIITPEHAQRGVRIARWSHLHGIAMLNRGLVERRWQRFEALQDLLKQRYNGTATLRDLRLRHGFSPDEVKSIADEHRETLSVETSKPATGRPSEVLIFTKK